MLAFVLPSAFHPDSASLAPPTVVRYWFRVSCGLLRTYVRTAALAVLVPSSFFRFLWSKCFRYSRLEIEIPIHRWFFSQRIFVFCFSLVFFFFFFFHSDKKEIEKKEKFILRNFALSNASSLSLFFFNYFFFHCCISFDFYQIFQLLSTLFENFLVIVIFFLKTFRMDWKFQSFDLFDSGDKEVPLSNWFFRWLKAKRGIPIFFSEIFNDSILSPSLFVYYINKQKFRAIVFVRYWKDTNWFRESNMKFISPCCCLVFYSFIAGKKKEIRMNSYFFQ